MARFASHTKRHSLRSGSAKLAQGCVSNRIPEHVYLIVVAKVSPETQRIGIPVYVVRRISCSAKRPHSSISKTEGFFAMTQVFS